MADDQENPEPPKLNVPSKKKVVKRQTKKLPKIKLSDSAASGSGSTQIPRVGVTGEVKSDTSRIDLPEDEKTLAPADMDTQVPSPASKNQTMRISLEQEVVDDTTEISPKDTSDLTAEIDLETDSVKSETGKMGIPGEVKSNTAKIDLSDAFETTPLDEDTADAVAGTGEDIFKSSTMPMESLDDAIAGAEAATELRAATPEELAAAADKSTTMPMESIDEAAAKADTHLPEGVQPMASVDEDEMFKSTTVPMTPLDEAIDGAEELTQIPSEDMFQAAKSSTMPMSALDDDGADPGAGGEDEIFKSTTLPMDSDAIQEAAGAALGAGAAAKPPRKKTMKISRKNLVAPPEGEEAAAADTSPPTESPEGPPSSRPRTIKLKRPDEQQLKTVKLQKQPAEGEKKSTSRIELPPELQSPETETPGRKKTIKLKRAPASSAETPSTAKTIQVNRPNRPASVAAPLGTVESVAQETGLDLELEAPAKTGPGAVWAILALFGLLVSGAASYFLYMAWDLANKY